MRNIVFLLLFSSLAMVKAQSLNLKNIYDNYQKYRAVEISTKRFNPELIYNLINKFAKYDDLTSEVLGKSVNGLPINLVKFGHGKTNILFWSQMHGDESTGTQALMDLFNYLISEDDKSFKNSIKENLSIYFIPLLNPDGASKFTRQNALQIDLNRDASRLQFPEAQILRNVQEKLKPKFGFNLHDQSTYYTAGNSFKSAAISFLAPAFNYKKDINEVRSNTMKLIAELKNILEEFIPGHLGRYNDDFEPRAFGDSFVKWGTSSVLIESGGWKNDPEKQFLRKINFIAYIGAINSILNQSYDRRSIEEYKSIPENDKLLFDLILRNCRLTYNDNEYTIDVGIKNNEVSIPETNDYYIESSVEEIGDLSIFYGYVDVDCQGLEIFPGKVYSGDEAEMTLDDYYQNGFLYVSADQILSKIPTNPKAINIISHREIPSLLQLNEPANFILKTNSGEVEYVIMNGHLWNSKSKIPLTCNGLIFN